MKRYRGLYYLILLFALIIPINVSANIMCNDGSVSKSCQDCHRGCCSHHGGCATTYSSNTRKSTKTKKASSTKKSTKSSSKTTKSNTTKSSTTTSKSKTNNSSVSKKIENVVTQKDNSATINSDSKTNSNTDNSETKVSSKEDDNAKTSSDSDSALPGVLGIGIISAGIYAATKSKQR